MGFRFIISLVLQIEEIQFYQTDHYSYFERSTNHLIGKVCHLFAIIMRALQIYQKQLAKMKNENSERLLYFIELVVSGTNLCVELKIFDEEDILIKVCQELRSKKVANKFQIFNLEKFF